MVQSPKHQFTRSLSIVPAIAAPLWFSTANLGRGEPLIPARPLKVLSQPLTVSVPKQPSRLPLIRQGNQISVNGRILPVAWSQWQLGTNATAVRTGMSDTGLMRAIGVELLSTWDVNRQPVQWFSQAETNPIILATRLTSQYRYLDITDLARVMGWHLQVDGTTLRINLPIARVQDLRQGKQSGSQRIILDLDRPTPWQVSQQGVVLSLQIDATTDPLLIQRFNPNPSNPVVLEEQGTLGSRETGELGNNQSPMTNTPCPIPHAPCPIKIQSAQNQTTIQVNIPDGLHPRVWSLPNPYRLVIDFQPEVMVERDILWGLGIRWRQQYVERRNSSSGKGASRFLVVWLEVNLRQPGLMIKPIWSNPNTLVGTAPLTQTAQQWQVAAAINGGFFNRNTQLPLGAIRRDSRWLSSPILNRGAIAWNDLGEVKIGHLSLQETLITSTGERLPVVSVNSGYIQPGIARHTPEWGTTYTPLSDNETIVVIQNNQVISQSPAGLADRTAFPIPPDGYLLAIRDNPATGFLAIGTIVRYETTPFPSEFGRYPQILGAGPVLLQNRQIVLDAKAEKFRDSFINESAVRSAIGITATGTLLITTVGNRTGGSGPTLHEIAELMRQLGAVDALNLDGGSSTSLYLGGQLLNRSPATAARVHNGLGIFLQPQP